MKKQFLTAEWRKLLILNYIIDPQVLNSYLPAGTELDLWNDKCYVSLVGFQFNKVRVMGVPIPFHTHFPEVNLRFYVKEKQADGSWLRGVVFIKEIVPKAAITFIANTLFKEKYQTCPMSFGCSTEGSRIAVRYEWEYDGSRQMFTATTFDKIPLAIEEGSEEEFITEHYWGYSRISEKETIKYGVEHPRWQYYPISKLGYNVNLGAVYGSDFTFLTAPHSVMLAEGSPITVRFGELLEV